MIRTGLVLVAATLLTVGTSFPAGAHTPEVSFFSPAPNSRVAGPKVEVQLDTAFFKLVAAGNPVFDGEGHAHLLVDRGPIPGGQTIPAGEADIIHIGSAPFDVREVTLSPGKHTLTAQLADSSHRALNPVAASQVTFTVGVGENFRGTGPLTPGCAEIATGNAAMSMVFPLQGGLVQGALRSTCAFDTEGGTCKFSEESYQRILGIFDNQNMTVDAKAGGTVTRRLLSGNPQVCGATATTPSAQSHITGSYANGQVFGALGQAQFTLKTNPSLVLSAPPAPDAATGTTTTLAAAAKAGSNKDKGLPAGRIALGLGAIALIAAGVVPLIRRRRSAGFTS